MARALAAWLMVASGDGSARDGSAQDGGECRGEPRRRPPAADADGLAQATRRAEIRRIARGLFDFDELARRALSRHWAGRTHEERAEFVRLFTDLLERSYLNRIEAYAGERIAYTSEVIDGTYATVRSKIITQRRSEVRINYRMHLHDGRWQVYDVLIDGVSFVSTYRSQNRPSARAHETIRRKNSPRTKSWPSSFRRRGRMYRVRFETRVRGL